MLQRAAGEDSEAEACDALTLVACSVDPTLEGCDACNAGEDNNEDVVVKSGDLVVSASSASSRKAIIGSDSDLDTLTFKTSEEVEITKVTLERYGYSDRGDVANVRLEDENGTKIAEPKSLNSKDSVTLSIKKDYRAVDGSLNATVVVKLANNVTTGGSIGFKVTDVESTAENVNLKNYDPYEYDMVGYSAVSVSLDAKGTSKNYNYEEGESYEIAKFKVKASSSTLVINGFTLTNDAAACDDEYTTCTGLAELDLEDFVKNVTVTADGEKIKGVSYSIDDDELTISFNGFEIPAKENATFAVSIELEDYDEYGQWAQFGIARTTDLNAVEKKTGARVTVTLPTDGVDLFQKVWAAHQFVGSKIKLTNTKLSNVEAAAGSDEIVVAEGTITITEPIKIEKYVITGNLAKDDSGAIEEMRLVIAGEEFDTSFVSRADKEIAFTFKNIEIEKSGKFQVVVDLDDDAVTGNVITFTPSFNKSIFGNNNAEYTDVKENVQTSEVAGSISFATKLTIQAAKAALENNLSKAVEFVQNRTSRKVVFDGIYTAKKGDVYLNTLEINGTDFDDSYNEITFYVFVDGEEVANADLNEEVVFSDVKVANGESVKVKVEAEVDAYGDADDSITSAKLELLGEDKDGNEAGHASDELVDMKVKEAGSTTISAASSKNTVLLKAKNQKIAEFTIKPSNTSDDDLELNSFAFALTGNSGSLTGSDIRVKIDGVEEEGEYSGSMKAFIFTPNVDMEDGVTVEVSLKNEYVGTVTGTVSNVNGGSATKTFVKRFENAVVSLHTEDLKGSTKVIVNVEKADDDYEVSELVITTDQLIAAHCTTDTNSKAGLNGEAACVADNYDAHVKGVWITTGITTGCYVNGEFKSGITQEVCLTESYPAHVKGTWNNASYAKYTLTNGEFSNEDDFEISASDKATHFITAIEYKVDDGEYTKEVKIEKSEFNDLFKDGSTYVKIFNVD